MTAVSAVLAGAPHGGTGGRFEDYSGGKGAGYPPRTRHRPSMVFYFLFFLFFSVCSRFLANTQICLNLIYTPKLFFFYIYFLYTTYRFSQRSATSETTFSQWVLACKSNPPQSQPSHPAGVIGHPLHSAVDWLGWVGLSAAGLRPCKPSAFAAIGLVYIATTYSVFHPLMSLGAVHGFIIHRNPEIF